MSGIEMRNEDVATQLTHCDTEPIHTIGSIQNQGFIIAVKLVSSNDIRITSISENILKAKWSPSSDERNILDGNIFELFDPLTASNMATLIHRFQLITLTKSETIDHHTEMLKVIGKNSRLSIGDTLLCCSCVGSSTPDTFILEIEEIDLDADRPISVPNSHILQSGDILGRIKAGDSPEGVTSSFLDAVMDVMKIYDRGMVYRFNDDFSGQVIHEKIQKESKIDSSYLGLRFPSGDIPLTARQLYMINRIRIVCDINGTESKLLSTNTDDLDLSMTFLRACSPMHLKYMHNMGISASLSIAIVVDGTLWGLYAFHSYTAPTKPSVEQRLMLEMVASISAMRVDFLQREAANKRKLEMSLLLRQLPAEMNQKEFLKMNHVSLLQLLAAHAIVVYETEDVHVYGDDSILPTKEGLQELNKRCKANTIITLSNFSQGLNGLGAGVMFYKHPQAAIALIRKSQVSDVHWGGTPDKVWDPTIPNRLTPRTSFELYIESSKEESRQWKPLDQDIAANFFERVILYLHDQMLDSFRLSLETANSETNRAVESAKERYEFFAHMSHELRTPFHGIVSSLQILKSSAVDQNERKDIVESALDCGNTMLQTLDDIITIAKARSCAETVRDPVLISKLVRTTKRMMGPIADNKNVGFKCDVGILNPTMEGEKEKEKENPLDGYFWDELVVMTDVTRVGQVTNNLTSNAIKFTPPGGSVTIRGFVGTYKEMVKSWKTTAGKFANDFIPTFDEGKGFDSLLHKDDPWYIFHVEDTGCGVTGEDVKKMFDAYKQVTSGKTGAYQGTGLGLHICRSHASQMNGVLAVASSRGSGTLFFFAIPVAVMPRSETPTKLNKSPRRSSRSPVPPRSSSTSPIPNRSPRPQSDRSISPKPGDKFSVSELSIPLTARSTRSSVGETYSPKMNEVSDTEKKSLSRATSAEKIPMSMSREMSEESDTPLTTDGKGCTFLIVDDSKVNLRMTKRKIQLQFQDIEVKTAEDGLEAITLYEENLAKKADPFTGIFMDYHMPKCSGLDAIVEIRKMERNFNVTRPVYIIAFTADLSETSTRALVAAGANEVMAKPTPSGTVEATCSYLINHVRAAELKGKLIDETA
jgi:light-regulated signal transduction histidine kinase (bacteriophytochrome)/ActR/RegA family two-component response regulator